MEKEFELKGLQNMRDNNGKGAFVIKVDSDDELIKDGNCYLEFTFVEGPFQCKCVDFVKLDEATQFEFLSSARMNILETIEGGTEIQIRNMRVVDFNDPTKELT